jgi:septal ring factor EnvC (AmiA/AmiB activator)
MLRAVSESDLEVIGDLREQSRNLSEATTQLRQALNAKRQLADAKQREQITLTNSRAKKQGIVETIREDEKKQEEMNRKYREDIENAQAEKNRFIREHERTRVRVAPSLDGYDFTRYKGKLPWPVTGTVVSTFGREVDSQTKTITENRGIEIETRQNEPVLSVGRGEIVITRYLRGYGNFVMVFHPPNYYSIYGHLADILVTPGQVVDQGEVIGIAGNTGLILETTPRLVLEILREEEPENPLSWLVGDDRRAQR